MAPQACELWLKAPSDSTSSGVIDFLLPSQGGYLLTPDLGAVCLQYELQHKGKLHPPCLKSSRRQLVDHDEKQDTWLNGFGPNQAGLLRSLVTSEARWDYSMMWLLSALALAQFPELAKHLHAEELHERLLSHNLEIFLHYRNGMGWSRSHKTKDKGPRNTAEDKQRVVGELFKFCSTSRLLWRS